MNKQLQPGRELDAEVARVVFKYGYGEAVGDNGEDLRWVYINGEGCPLPHYSTDIATAWQVVEKFVVSGKEPLIEYYYGQWHVDLAGSGYMEESANTVAHAICLAALKAVGA